MQRMRAYNLLLMVFLLLAAPLAPAEVVNINKADTAAMQEHLTGIGPVKSKAIVDYRKQNGDFKSLDDLLKVPGIGPTTLDKIRGSLSTTRGVTRASEGFKAKGTGNDASTVSGKKKGSEKAVVKTEQGTDKTRATDSGKATSGKKDDKKGTTSASKKPGSKNKATSDSSISAGKKTATGTKTAKSTSKGTQKSSSKDVNKDPKKSSSKSKSKSKKSASKTTKSSTNDSKSSSKK